PTSTDISRATNATKSSASSTIAAVRSPRWRSTSTKTPATDSVVGSSFRFCDVPSSKNCYTRNRANRSPSEVFFEVDLVVGDGFYRIVVEFVGVFVGLAPAEVGGYLVGDSGIRFDVCGCVVDIHYRADRLAVGVHHGFPLVGFVYCRHIMLTDAGIQNNRGASIRKVAPFPSRFVANSVEFLGQLFGNARTETRFVAVVGLEFGLSNDERAGPFRTHHARVVGDDERESHTRERLAGRGDHFLILVARFGFEPD